MTGDNGIDGADRMSKVYMKYGRRKKYTEAQRAPIRFMYSSAQCNFSLRYASVC